MINNTEDIKDTVEESKKPDENSGLLLQSFFKIVDPDTGEVLIQGRS